MSPTRRADRRRAGQSPVTVGPRHVRGPHSSGGAGRHVQTSAPAGETQPAPSSARSGLLRSSAVMAAGTLLSRILGFARVWLLTVAIGQNTGAGNAFQVANNLPNLLYMLTMGGMLNAILVPQIVRATKHPDGGRVYVNRLITWCLLIIAVVTVVTTFLTPWLIPLQTKTRDPAFLDLTTAFALWCVPQVMFYGLYTVFGQYLNARGRFGAYMWSPVAANVVQLVGLVVFLVWFGPTGAFDRHPAGSWTPSMVTVLAGSSTLGIVVQALILLPTLRRAGFRYRPTFGLRGVGLRSAGTAAGWTVLTTVMTSLAAVATTKAATPDTTSRSVAGVAAIATGALLMQLPHSFIGVSLVTALFTPVTEAAREGRWGQIRFAVSSGLRNVGVFNMVATAGLVGLALPIAAVFSSSTVEAEGVAYVIAARSLGLVFYTAAYLLWRVCYAYEDARTPFLTQVPEYVFMVLVAVGVGVVPVQWVAATISLAWSVGSLLSFVLVVLAVQRRYGSLGMWGVTMSHVRMLIPALVAGAVSARLGLWLLHLLGAHGLPLRLNGVIASAGGGTVLLLVYVAGLWMVRAPELTGAMSMVRRRLGR